MDGSLTLAAGPSIVVGESALQGHVVVLGTPADKVALSKKGDTVSFPVWRLLEFSKKTEHFDLFLEQGTIYVPSFLVLEFITKTIKTHLIKASGEAGFFGGGEDESLVVTLDHRVRDALKVPRAFAHLICKDMERIILVFALGPNLGAYHDCSSA